MAPPDPDLDDTCGFLTLTGEADGYLDENVYGTYVLMDALPCPGFGGMNTYTGIYYLGVKGGKTRFLYRSIDGWWCVYDQSGFIDHSNDGFCRSDATDYNHPLEVRAWQCWREDSARYEVQPSITARPEE
jgi:hypothetical protein